VWHDGFADKNSLLQAAAEQNSLLQGALSRTVAHSVGEGGVANVVFWRLGIGFKSLQTVLTCISVFTYMSTIISVCFKGAF